MKKIATGLLAFMIFITQNSGAAGVHDGIWNSSLGFLSLHEQDGHVAILTLSPSGEVWEAWFGPINGNRASVDTIVSEVSAQLEFVFTSATTGEYYMTFCNPISSCGIQNNVTYYMYKIW